MPYSIKDLNPRHHKIVEFVLRGWTNRQIAEHFQMSDVQVGRIKNSPSFQHELAVRRDKVNDLSNQAIAEADDEVTKTIRAGALRAVSRLCGSVDSDKEENAIRASVEILDRAGYPKVSRVEQKSISLNMTADVAELIKETIELDRG